MTHDTDTGVAGPSRVRSGGSEQLDRLLVIAAIVLWLVALGAGVAAVVALVGLANGHSVAVAGESDTPWLLYSVIGVSAAVIIGAIPLLLRARHAASPEVAAPRSAAPDDGDPAGDVPSVGQRVQPFGAPVLRRHSTPPAGSRVGFPTAAVERIWVRCTSTIAAAMGAAATGIGVATYLMASDHDTAAWAVYAVAGIITVAMPLAPWFFLRQLRDVLESSR